MNIQSVIIHCHNMVYFIIENQDFFQTGKELWHLFFYKVKNAVISTYLYPVILILFKVPYIHSGSLSPSRVREIECVLAAAAMQSIIVTMTDDNIIAIAAMDNIGPFSTINQVVSITPNYHIVFANSIFSNVCVECDPMGRTQRDLSSISNNKIVAFSTEQVVIPFASNYDVIARASLYNVCCFSSAKIKRTV